MSRTRLLVALGLSLVTLAASGCGKREQKVRPEQTVLLLPATDAQLNGWQTTLDLFTKATQIDVAPLNVPREEYWEELQKMIARGEPPDVAIIDSEYMPELAATGALSPLDTHLSDHPEITPDEYLPHTWEAFQYEGHSYGVPFDLRAVVLLYNEDYFETKYVDPPAPGWTWQDYAKRAADLTMDTNDDGRVDVYGTTLCRWWQLFVWQNGGTLVDDARRPTRSTLSTPAAVEALQFLADLDLKQHAVVPPARAERDPIQLFGAGRAAMTFATHGDIITLDKFRNLRFQSGPVPRGKQEANLASASGLCLLAGARHPEEAWKLIADLSGGASQVQLADMGLMVPARTEVANSRYFGLGPGPQSPYLGNADAARPLPITPKYSQIKQVWDEELRGVWLGDTPVEDACRRIDERVNAILAGESSASLPQLFALGRPPRG